MAEPVEYFIPPELGQAGVLAGKLSPLPANACDVFLRAYVPDGGLVWDPFCRSDAVARSAARLGKRALLSDFNPLIAFMVRASLNTVSARQLDRAFASLAAAPTMQTTLESHITSLYATTCPACGKATVARSFVWSGEPALLREKDLACPTCNTIGTVPVGEADLALASGVEERGRAYWTLLERLGASEGALRPLAERLIEGYTSRSLYALATIQRELEILPVERDVREVLMLGLLEAMVRCTKAYGEEQARQRAVSSRLGSGGRGTGGTPAGFVESNCWMVFAAACTEQRARLERESGSAAYLQAALLGKARAGAAVAEAEGARISVRQASARRAAAGLAEGSVDLILTSPPPLEGADMLQLMYLWTGWLLGKDDARLFSPEYLLRPKRATDWAWFFAAMQKNLRAMAGVLAAEGKVVLCLPLSGMTYLNVLMLAAAAAGLQLEGIAYQPSGADGLRRPLALGPSPGYCYLRLAPSNMGQALSPISTDSLLETARRETVAASMSVVKERGEPSAYVWLYLAALMRLSRTGILTRLVALPPADAPSWDRLRHVLTSGLQGQEGQLVFMPWGAAPTGARVDAAGLEDEAAQDLARRHGWWWLAEARDASLPLSDRVEWAVYTVLSTTNLSTLEAVAKVVYALFPGLQTPESGLIEACVQSYATPASPVHWQLRPADALAERTSEHLEMMSLLAELGHRLGFKVWLSRGELRNRQYGQTLQNLLTVAERYLSVDEILPRATEHSQLIDVIWYRNRRASHVFEVEWTAMLGESVLRRGSQGQGVRRFVVVPPERAGLIQSKIERLPLLRSRLADDGWLFLRFDALRDLCRAETVHEEDLALNAGFKRVVGQEGLQLALW